MIALYDCYAMDSCSTKVTNLFASVSTLRNTILMLARTMRTNSAGDDDALETLHEQEIHTTKWMDIGRESTYFLQSLMQIQRTKNSELFRKWL